MMRSFQTFFFVLATAVPFFAPAGPGRTLAGPPEDRPWARVTEDDRAIKVETDRLEAVIPKNHPKHWMTGIEKGSFLDKATAFREAGDGAADAIFDSRCRFVLQLRGGRIKALEADRATGVVIRGERIRLEPYVPVAVGG
jgi:hypothetical protein